MSDFQSVGSDQWDEIQNCSTVCSDENNSDVLSGAGVLDVYLTEVKNFSRISPEREMTPG